MTSSARGVPGSAPRRPRARVNRTTLFFAGMALFDVLIWTAAALAR
jgi:hypothetical protein